MTQISKQPHTLSFLRSTHIWRYVCICCCFSFVVVRGLSVELCEGSVVQITACIRVRARGGNFRERTWDSMRWLTSSRKSVIDRQGCFVCWLCLRTVGCFMTINFLFSSCCYWFLKYIKASIVWQTNVNWLFIRLQRIQENGKDQIGFGSAQLKIEGATILNALTPLWRKGA